MFTQKEDALVGIKKSIRIRDICEIEGVFKKLKRSNGKVYDHSLKDTKHMDLRIGWRIGDIWVYIKWCDFKACLFDMAIKRKG
jgi:hypothetical protein